MHQFQVFLRTRRAQQLDRPMADPAAAVAGHAGRLVDDQEVLVLENDRLGDLGYLPLARPPSLHLVSHPHRRDTQRIAVGETRIGFGPFPVHAHLSGAQQSVNHALGYALEQGHQGVVDALPVALRADLDLTYTVRCVPGSCRLH